MVIALVATGCGGNGESAVAASIGDTEITAADVDAVYASRAEAPSIASELAADDSQEPNPDLQASVLTALLRTEVLRLAAEERGIEITDEQRSEARAAIVEQVGGADALQRVLDDANISDDEFRTNLVDQAIQTQIIDELAGDVDDEAVRAAYDEDPQGQYGEQVEVRHILTETEEQAADAIDRIEGGEEFAEVAQDVSTDQGSAERGGDLGPVTRGMTVEPFEEAAFGAEVGELVGPVETDFGFHVIEVTEQTPAPEFSEVESDIRQQLAQQQFGQFITEFASGLEVEVNPAYGTWDPQQLVVVPPAPSEAPSALPQPDASALPLPDLSEAPLPSERTTE